MKLFNIKTDNYYFINGLRRSGNHLLISWIVSNYKKVLLVNDVDRKPIIDPKTHNEHFKIQTCYQEDNKFTPNINKNLINKKDELNNIDCLIFTMEDKKLENFYETIKYFKTGENKVYKILILRDIFNTIASRLEAIHSLKNKVNYNLKKEFNVDEYFIEIWNNMIEDKISLKFNYNKFILDYNNYRKKFGKLIGLEYPSINVLEKVPMFGHGSSFKPNSKNAFAINDLLTRYKKYQHLLIYKKLYNDNNLIQLLENEFLLCHKIAFMFLTINDVNNPKIWENYFRDIRKYNIYMHPKNKNNVKSFFKNYIIKNIVNTNWGLIIDAYKELMKEAIKDDILNKYFIIISESDIPIKSFNNLYNHIDNNIIELWRMKKYNLEVKMKNLEFPKNKLIKHSAFFCLERKTLEKLLKSKYLDEFKKHQYADEMFLSIVYDKNKFKNEILTYANWKDSEDKYKKYKKLYYKYLNKNNIKKADFYKKLYENIIKHPKIYNKLESNVLKNKAYFARKFKKLNNNDKKKLINIYI